MSQMLNKYNLFLSSAQRNEGGTPSNFDINIKPNIGLTKGKNSHFRIYIHSATIPFSWTQWSSVNNTTQIQLLQGTKTFNGSFSIPSGNYDIYSFSQAWKSSLETELAVLNAYFPNILMSYDINSNKVMITLPPDASSDTKITFYNNDGYTEVNKALGFFTEWSVSQNSSTISQVQIDINPARVLYMYSNNLASPHNLEALTSSCTTSTQICAIPITVLPNNYIVFQPYNYLVSTIGNKNFSKINLQLQSEDLPPDINLQNFNLDWSCVLVLEEWETIDTNISKIDHFLALQDERDKAKDEEIQRQRQALESQRQEILDGLQKQRKRLKSSLGTNKDDEQN